ncbi:putative bifunctional diguanylate cyclase/phosphodiesterase [Pseudaeromonas paramecii]|uniref:EAL domain-containing protein n=1 Tax=Pseudaeromonas paramecii TaxID=2138166 RepID=A0ABP8Q7E8_9GAMM
MLLPVPASASPRSPSRLLLWDHQQASLVSLMPGHPVPSALLPEPQQPWPAQLGAPWADLLLTLCQGGDATQLLLDLPGGSWQLQLAPGEPPHCFIWAEPHQSSQPTLANLALLELDKLGQHLARGQARASQLLQALHQLSRCDRLLLWRLDDETMTPLLCLGDDTMPPPQKLEPRYLKALRRRRLLGYSDLQHQPNLSAQRYLQHDGILARLDGLVQLDEAPAALITLEYRLLQPSFDALSFNLLSRTCELMAANPPLPEGQAAPAGDSPSAMPLDMSLTGQPWLEAVAKYLAETCHASWVLICEHLPALHPSQAPEAVSLAYYAQGQLHAAIHFPLSDRPCADLLSRGPLWLEGEALLPYGHCQPAGQPPIQAYYGYPLHDEVGAALGHVCLGFSQPRQVHQQASALLASLAPRLQDSLRLHQLNQRLHLLGAAFEQAQGMLLVNRLGLIERVNRAFSRFTGFTEAEVLGWHIQQLEAEGQTEQLYEAVRLTLTQADHWEGQSRARRADGSSFAIRLQITGIYRAGRLSHYLCAFEDIEESLAAQCQIEWLAYRDELTGLFNRRGLLEQMTHALTPEAAPSWGALLILDVDQFGSINDSLGPAVGDALLQALVTRIQQQVPTRASWARLSADQLALLLPLDAMTREAALAEVEAQARCLLAQCQTPFALSQLQLHISCSLGATLIPPSDPPAPLDLLQQAEAANHSAKQRARGSLAFYDQAMAEALRRRLALSSLLREALRGEAFELYYQPQYRVADGQLVGAEALLRWQHDGQFISPAEFIPVAEESSLIYELGFWVLRHACEQGVKWQAQGLPLNSLSVNVSARQFHHPDFMVRLASILAQSTLAPHRLMLEITESVVLENLPETLSRMAQIKQMGIRLSIDDFGTGYSSLAYLKDLPVDEVKLDRSFITRLAFDHKDRVMVSGIITLGQVMGFKVTAEGVEEAEQLAVLHALGCHQFQGYLRSRPLPAAEFVRQLQAADQNSNL